MNDRKFYIDRKLEMISLRDGGWNDIRIGEMFDISRERVAQIIGRGDHQAARNKHEIIRSLVDKTNRELAKEFHLQERTVSNIRSNLFHAMSGHRSETHYKWMLWGKEYLEDRGYSVHLLSSMHPYDALVNGKHIDIIAAETSMHAPSRRIKNPMYRFKISHTADFYFVIVAPTMDVFVIPESEIKPSMQYLCFVWPTTQYKSKWHTFHNRLDLFNNPYFDEICL